MKVLFVPIEELYESLMLFRDDELYKARHNSQIISLRKVLNDYFDPTLRRIEVKNAVLTFPTYFYEEQDNQPVIFSEESDNAPVLFFEEEDFNGGEADFFVLIPPDIVPTSNTAAEGFFLQIKAKIDYFKLFSKTYQIIQT
ncbi:hypothetical protein EZY14_009380 [Kordia sp. TARA_039_SRF]|nr:hypothetical protein EZY14_009380 [Kordia sp. TARA_039_SRF]